MRSEPCKFPKPKLLPNPEFVKALLNQSLLNQLNKTMGNCMTTGIVSTIGADVGSTAALLVCRTAASCAMTAVNTYTGELFPTPFRQSAVGLTSSMASIVSIFAPIVGGPLVSIHVSNHSLVEMYTITLT